MSNKIYGLVGRKLGHSYSVPIHNMLGNNDYKLYELEPEELGKFVRRPDIGALNVTIPYKGDVIPFLDEVAPDAAAIGSVNTVVNRGGRLYGYNTDLYGFDYTIKRSGIRLAGKKALIFGGGGSSRTVSAALRAAGVSEFVVISREGKDNYDNLDRHAGAQILINTTPVGMFPEPGKLIAAPARFPDCEGLIDLIYNPLRTAFLMRARELGIKCAGGLPMLVAQAVKAHELFFDTVVAKGETERILRSLTRSVENIVLIGMPGSGKSTIGRALATLTAREFIDTDETIERIAGRPIPEIFADSGEAAFRELEREAIRTAGMRSGTVIVTGGGAVKDEHNYAPLRQNSRIYRLDRPLGQLAREGRPLSMGADLTALAAEREPLYRRFADATVPVDGVPEHAAQLILEDFNENSGD
jgi:Shikimate 5-dehydrogenase